MEQILKATAQITTVDSRTMLKFTRLSLLCCMLIHIQILVNNEWMTDFFSRIDISIMLTTLLAIFSLLYPVFGWIAEVCVGKYNMILVSFVTILVASIVTTAGMIVLFSFGGIINRQNTTRKIIETCIILAIFISIAGIAMYEANAIQFSMDQMLEESSQQLSSFIYWYYWCTNIPPLVLFYITIAMIAFVKTNCQNVDYTSHGFQIMILIVAGFQTLAVVIGMLSIMFSKRYTSNNRVSRNSLLIITQVLKYAYKNKYPQMRSAFTYWENNIPSRIDLGKQKYGGPFTYDQVEGVKTFFRLLLLIFSLFGVFLQGDGYSLTFYVMNTFGCPTVIPFVTVLANPKHVPTLVIIFGIPLLQIIKKLIPHRLPNMLTRIGIGMVICVLTQLSIIAYSFAIKENKFDCPEIYCSFDSKVLIIKTCAFAAIANSPLNSTCVHYCTDPPIASDLYIVYLAVIPLLLQGISHLMVFLTTLEFICAQSPNETKGLLIGIWYSMLSIKYLINIADKQPALLDNTLWSIYHGVKGLAVLVSIVCFMIVSRHYRYREKNETVNRQAIIEEQYERELLLNSSDESDTSDE